MLKKITRNYLLSFGTVTLITTPIAAVISCGTQTDSQADVNTVSQKLQDQDYSTGSTDQAISYKPGDPVSPSDLGIDLGIDTLGTSISCTVVEADSEAGTATIKAVITKDGFITEATFTIKGFKSQSQADVDAVQAQYHDVVAVNPTIIPAKLEVGRTIDLQSLGITEPDTKDTTVVYVINDINIVQGTVNVQAQISKNDKTATANFTVSNLLKLSEYLTQIFDSPLDLHLNQGKTWADFVTNLKLYLQSSQLFSNEQKSWLQNIDLSPDFISHRNETIKNLMNLENKTAQAKVAVYYNNVEYDYFVNLKDIAIVPDQISVNNVIKKFLKVQTTSNTTFYPNSWVNGQTKTALDLGIVEPNTEGATVTYTIQAIDLANGIIDVNVLVEKTCGKASTTIKITGFVTSGQQNLSDIAQVISNFNKIQNTTLVNYYPSNWGAGQSIDAATLGIVEPSDLKGANLSYQIQTIDLANGLVTVQVTVSKGSQSQIFTLQVKNYFTITQQNNLDILKVQNNFINPQTTSNTSFYSKNWVAGQSVTVFDLGIVEPDKNGATIVYEIKAVNLANGSVTVLATISKGEQSLSFDLNVNGFLTTDQQDNLDVLTVATNFNQNQATSNKDVYPNLWKTSQQVSASDLGIIEPINKLGTTISYSIQNIDLINGVVTVNVTVNKNAHQSTFTLTVFNFRTTNVQNKLDVEKVKASFSDFQTTTNQSFYPSTWTSSQAVTKNELGIEEPDQQGATISYTIQAVDLENGNVQVLAKITKNGQSTTLLLTIQGFKTTIQQNQDDVNQVANNFEKTQVTSISLYPNAWNNGQQVSANDLGISEPDKNGTLITYTIQSIDLEKGIVVVNVTVSKGSKSATLNLTVNGFNTSSQQNQIDVNQIANNFNTTQVTTNTNVYPSDWVNSQVVIVNQLGISEPAHDGATISYSVQSIDLEKGIVVVQATITKGNQNAQVNVTISGFLTTNQQDLIDVNNVIKNFVNPQVTSNRQFYPSSWTASQNVNLSVLGIVEPNNNGTSITYVIKLVNLTSGTVVATVTVTKNGQSSSFDLTIQGFKTTSQQNQDDVNQVANNFEKTQVTNVSLYPNAWVAGQQVSASDLGVVEPINNGASITYMIQSVDLSNGTVVVNVTVSKGLQSKTLNLTINGFITSNQQNQDDVNQVINNFNLNQTTSIKDFYPSQWFKGQSVNLSQIGIVEPNNQGVSIEYVIESINLNTGIVVVKATITKGNKSGQVNITISGFLTTNQQNQIDVNQIANNFNTTQVTTNNNFYPSTWAPSQIVNLSDLGIVEPNASNATITYLIKSVNLSSGTVIVTATIVKNNQKANVDVTIQGFMTSDQQNAIDVNQVKANFVKSQPTTNNNFYPGSWNVGQTIDVNALGITEPDKINATITYQIVNLNLNDGSIVVKATIAKGSQTTDVNVTINGFLTTNQYNQSIISTVVANFNVNQITTNSFYPNNWTVGQQVSVNDLGISEPDSQGCLITYKIKSIDLVTGTVTVEVNISKNDQSTTIDLNVTGFKTTRDYNQEIVNNVVNNFNTNQVTTKNAFYPNSWTVGQTVSATDLGISEPNNQGSTISYSILSIDLDSGNVEVKANVILDKANANQTITITGFLTSDQQNLLDVNSVIANLSSSQTTFNTTFYPSSWNVNQNVSISDLGIANPENILGTTITYTIQSIDLVKGVITVQALVSKGDQSKSTILTVDGFLTTEMQNQSDVDAVANIFNANQMTNNTAFYPNDWINGQSVSLKDLGISEPKANGTTINYTIQTVNLEHGSVTVVAKITKGSKIATKTITITGFLISDAYNLNIVNNVIKNFKNFQQTTNTSFYPGSWIGGQQVSVSDLGIVEPDNQGATITYVIQSVDIALGTVIVKATVSLGNKTVDQTITITGFKTNDQQNKDDVDNVKNAFNTNQVTTSTTFYPGSWKPGQELNLSDLGIAEPENKLVTSIRYTIQSVDLDNGTVVVQAQISKGSQSDTQVINISGFLTTDQSNQSDVDAVANDFNNVQTTTKSSFYPSDWVNGRSVTLDQLGISQPSDQRGTTITYQIQAINLDTGQVTVIVTVSKGDQSAQQTLTINGFLTTDQNNNTIVNTITSSFNTGQNTTNTIYPDSWKIGQTVNLSDLGISEPTNNGASITYTIQSINLDTGTVVVIAKITKGKAESTQTITINNFITTDQQNQSDVNAVKDAFNTNQITTLTNFSLDSWNPNQTVNLSDLGISEPENTLGTSIVYTINTIDSDQGSVTVDVTITKGNQSATQTINITGFKTTSQQPDNDVNDVANDFNNVQTTTKSSFYPSDWVNGQSVTLDQLGISEPSDQRGTTITYQIQAINLSAGQVSVIVTVSKDNLSAQRTLTINGFLTTDQNDQNIVDGIVNSFNISQDTSNNTIYPDSWKIGQNLNLSDLGISEPANNGASITYTIQSVDLSTGIVVVIATITKGNASNTLTLTINNFITTDQQNQSDVDAVKNAFNTNQLTLNRHYYPSDWTANDIVSSTDLGLTEPSDLKGASITYSIQSVDLDTGKVIVIATITKGDALSTQTITINNFITTDQQNQNDVNFVINNLSSQITTNSSFYPSEWASGQSVTIDQLGISEPSETRGTTITYQIQSINLSTGQVIVVATVSKGNQTRQEALTINGFLTTDQNDQNIVNNVTNSFDTTQNSSNDSIYPSSWKPGQNVTTSDLCIFEPENMGTTITYTINSIDLATGTVIVTATISKGNISNSVTITINNFMTTDQYNLSLVKSLVNNFATSQVTTQDAFYPKSWTIGQQVSGSDLGISEPVNDQNAGFEYTIQSIDLDQGIVLVNVLVGLNGQSQSFTLSVSGFVITNQYNLQIIKTVVSSIANVQNTSQTNLYPNSWAIGQSLTANDLGIQEPDLQGSNTNYHVVSIDLANGTVVVKVTVSLGQKSLQKNITIQEFLTTAKNNQNVVNNVLNSFNQSQVSSNNTFYPSSWTVGQSVSASELGISEPDNQGSTISYQIKSIDLSTGKVNVDVVISLGDQNASDSLTITGFLTTVENNQQLVKNVVQNFATSIITTQNNFYPSSWKPEQTVNLSDLGISEPDNQGATLSYVIKNIDLSTGIVTVEVTATIGDQNASQTLEITNFQTTDQQNQANVTQVINNFQTKQTTSQNNLYPNSWTGGQSVSASDLGIIEPDNQGTTITYTVESVNLQTGEVVINVQVLQGTKSAKTTLTIDGFFITSQYNKTVVNNVANVFNTNQDTTQTNFYPNNLTTGQTIDLAQLGISEPNNQGATITYTVQSIDLDKGIIVVIANINLGDQNASQTITIKGFLTTDQNNQTIVDNVAASFNTTQITSLNDFYPSQWTNGQTVSLKDLGISEPANNNSSITYTIQSIDLKNGQVTVQVNITLADKSASQSVIINGFLTTGQFNQTIVNNVVNSFTTTQSTTNSNFYPNTLTVGKTANLDQLGITEPDKNNASITYIVQSINLTTGQVVVKAIVSLGNQSANVIITINDFMTSDQHNQNVVNNVITNFDSQITTTKTNFYGDSWTVGQTISATDLGITEPDNQGSSITYTIQSIDLKTGQVSVLVNASLGEKSAQTSISISGFLTTDQNNQNIVNNVATSFNTTQITSQNNVYPDGWSAGKTITLDELGISEPNNQGSSITYKIQSIDLTLGQVVVIANITLQDQSSSQTIAINGFTTTDQNNQNIVNNVASNFNLNQNTSQDNLYPNSWKVGQTLSANDLGISEPENIQGSTITYTVQSIDLDQGIVVVKATITFQDQSTTISINIKNFVTTNQNNQNIVNNLANTFNVKQTTSQTNFYPSSWTVGQSVSVNDLGISEPENPNGATITYTIQSIDLTLGQVVVIANITFQAKNAQATINITGFATNSQNDQDTVNNVTASFDTNQTTTQTSFYPDSWTTNQQVSLNDLGITEPDNQGTTITYTIQSIDLDNGQVTVQANISLNDKTATQTITINGFVKSSQNDQNIVNNIVTNFNQNQTTTLNKFYPNTWANCQVVNLSQLGISEPEKQNALITYTIQSIDLDNGQVTVQANISLNGKTATQTITINGFLTTSQNNQNIVNQVLNNFNNKLTRNNNFYPSSWTENQLVLASDLGISEPNNQGSSITYTIQSIDLSTGIVTVNVNVSLGDQSSSKSITISGFRTTDAQDYNDVENLLNNLGTSLITSNQSFYPITWTIGQELNASQLGITDPENLNGAVITYTISSIDLANGIVQVNVSITKGSQQASDNINITGFANDQSTFNLIQSYLNQFISSNPFDINQTNSTNDTWTSVLNQAIIPAIVNEFGQAIANNISWSLDTPLQTVIDTYDSSTGLATQNIKFSYNGIEQTDFITMYFNNFKNASLFN